jgi:redox-regulated HSP33 family molecular chaperone
MTAAAFEGADDVVLPFSVEGLDVRGRVVRLGPSIDSILARHGYPDAVARVIGEAAALTVLLGSSLKFEGRFQLQTKTSGPITMIVVDFDAPDRIRATARFDTDRIDALGPVSPERRRQGDLAPGDIPEGYPAQDAEPLSEDDAWVEAKSLVETVEDHELIDPGVSSERLLYRLFHERGVRVFNGLAVHEACRCSRERIIAMMRNFPEQDRRDMIGDNGRIGITCEFCSTVYDLDPREVEEEIARPEAG